MVEIIVPQGENMLNQYRQEIYTSFEERSDIGMNLVDALSSAAQVESPVRVSESPLFGRKFSAIYDFLEEGRINVLRLRGIQYKNQPADAETIAGYEVYALDCSDDPHPEAETFPDRTYSKKGKGEPTLIGYRYSFLVRVTSWRPSWCMPQDIERVKSETTDSHVGAEQVKRLDSQSRSLKVVVADSLYCNYIFLGMFLCLQTIYALVRVRHNQVLYEEPEIKVEKKAGRPAIHGSKFKPAAPNRSPDRQEDTTLWGQKIRLQAWHNLHFYKLPFLVGLLLSVEFLKADNTPRFKRPLLLFWSGPLSVSLIELAQMYLWRFAIEHMFRFFKQHLGLCSCRSPNPEARLRWVWSCAIAYSQLLLMRHSVVPIRPPWFPIHRQPHPPLLTARQVQRNALAFLLDFGTPARPTRPAGNGSGRPTGYHPPPRTHYSIIQKKTEISEKGAKTQKTDDLTPSLLCFFTLFAFSPP
jgi:hypothetical protein